MLSVEYEPWNYYCYSLDAKASLPFKERIRQLASCFPNVLVAEREYAVYSNGKNVTRSHLACLERLLERGADWRYAILLQNYDIPHKTNAEKVEILHLYQGANDIATKKVMPISVAKGQNWTLAALKLYRNGERGTMSFKTLAPCSGEALDSRNREMARNANGSLREVDVNTFIDTLEASPYGMDEDFYSTLNTNLPDFPGGFTTSCLRDHNQQVANMGRYVLWQRNARCMSRKFRHDICVFGAEDLAQLAREQSIAPVYLNKMMPIFDFGTSYCWLKRLAERRLGGEVNINASLYQDQPHVSRWEGGADVCSALSHSSGTISHSTAQRKETRVECVELRMPHISAWKWEVVVLPLNSIRQCSSIRSHLLLFSLPVHGSGKKASLMGYVRPHN
jgi:hypothetical protein